MSTKNERNKTWLALVSVAISIAALYLVWQQRTDARKAIVVVDAVRLFDGYNMKKELETLAKHQLEQEGKQLDSIHKLLQLAQAAQSDPGEIQRLSRLYDYVKGSLENDYQQSNHEINEKVWKRLNPLLQEYGKKNGLHLIIGANGTGNVLYNDEYFEKTNDVINYANKRYAQGE